MLHQELTQYCPRIIEFDTSKRYHRERKPTKLPVIKDDNKYYLDVIIAIRRFCMAITAGSSAYKR